MLQHMQGIPGSDRDRQMQAGTMDERANHYVYQQTSEALVMGLQGKVVLPGNPDYEAARTVWNGAADRHPSFIVRRANVGDVIAAVTFAREQGMPISVRSGGHSPAGYGTNDGGMVIDLSLMKSITIDPERRIARLEPGLTWNEVANTLQPHGLALSSGDTGTVGVGGLLLGGGIGWMVRKYGLALDRMRAVELVTAEGEFLRASADEHAELFWGLRGGGGNFGIATAFEVDLHPGGIVLGGAVFYEITEAEAILREYARYAAAAPDELTTMALLMAAPPAPFIPPAKQGMPVVAILLCYTGDLTQGEQVVAPLRKMGTVVADVIAPMPYPVMFTFAEEAGGVSPETMMQVRILGGAMSRVPIDATAFAHRDKQVMISVFDTQWQPGNGEHLARAEQMWQALFPYAEGVYVNFLMDEGEQRVHQAYPPATYARLAALKQCYDPTNLFHLNQNIRPATR
jgi:FAD/FMN-containing dehydrogenase